MNNEWNTVCHHLSPSFSAFDKRVLYSTFSLSPPLTWRRWTTCWRRNILEMNINEISKWYDDNCTLSLWPAIIKKERCVSPELSPGFRKLLWYTSNTTRLKVASEVNCLSWFVCPYWKQKASCQTHPRCTHLNFLPAHGQFSYIRTIPPWNSLHVQTARRGFKRDLYAAAERRTSTNVSARSIHRVQDQTVNINGGLPQIVTAYICGQRKYGRSCWASHPPQCQSLTPMPCQVISCTRMTHHHSLNISQLSKSSPGAVEQTFHSRAFHIKLSQCMHPWSIVICTFAKRVSSS